MSAIQDQSTVGLADRANGNVGSGPKTSTEKEYDLEARPIGKQQEEEKLHNGDTEGVFRGWQRESDDPTASKDFPDLAPSKSMDFPDGLIVKVQDSQTGGRNAWLTVVGGYLCLFCSFGKLFLCGN